MLYHPSDAEDATQEVFVRACRHLEKVPGGDLEALRWLYRISTNYCLNAMRNRWRRADSLDDWPEPARPDAERALLDREVVRRLLIRMPEKLRAPVVLYYLDDMDQKGVAQVLGVSTRTVINRLNDFRRRAKLYSVTMGQMEEAN